MTTVEEMEALAAGKPVYRTMQITRMQAFLVDGQFTQPRAVGEPYTAVVVTLTEDRLRKLLGGENLYARQTIEKLREEAGFEE